MEPLKISLSAIGDFLVNWVIPGRTIKKFFKNECIIFDNQQLCKKAAQCVPPIRVSSTGTYTQNFMEMAND